MVNTFFLQITAAFCLFVSLTNQALAETVECPPSISVKESLDQAPPPTWVAQQDNSTRYLAGVTFFDGDPKQNISIAPSSDSLSQGKNRVALWRFGSSDVAVWLGCRYQDTGIFLTQKLPAAYKECRVLYAPGGIIKSINCK